MQILRMSPVTRTTVPWVLEQYVRRRTMYASASRVRLLSRAWVDHLYVNLMDDPQRHGLITTGLLAVVWALSSCKRVSTFGFGGGIDLVRNGTQTMARYNYYSLHSNVTEHVLWPWHDWDKENQLHNRFEALGALRRWFPAGAEHLRHFKLPDWCASQSDWRERSCRLPTGGGEGRAREKSEGSIESLARSSLHKDGFESRSDAEDERMMEGADAQVWRERDKVRSRTQQEEMREKLHKWRAEAWESTMVH